jgi:hypothetical protein
VEAKQPELCSGGVRRRRSGVRHRRRLPPLVFAEGDLVEEELTDFARLTKIKDFCKMQSKKELQKRKSQMELKNKYED